MFIALYLKFCEYFASDPSGFEYSIEFAHFCEFHYDFIPKIKFTPPMRYRKIYCYLNVCSKCFLLQNLCNI